MLSREQQKNARTRAAEMLARAGFVLTPSERENIEIADLSLNELEKTGVQLVTYINTDRCCAKELVLYYTVFHEVELNPGEQYTISSDTLHGFQAGEEGAIISEFSSTSRDESDKFTDPRIQRIPEVKNDQ